MSRILHGGIVGTADPHKSRKNRGKFLLGDAGHDLYHAEQIRTRRTIYGIKGP
jgi:hypothetical protein